MFSYIRFLAYRLATMAHAFKVLYRLSPEKTQAFFDSYEIFQHNWADEKRMIALFGPGFAQVLTSKLIDYHSVINYLCAIGQVEKMYIPPIFNPCKSLIANQNLFEQKMARDLNLKEGDRALQVSAGRGRTACHLAKLTRSHITGFSADAEQFKSAQEFAKVTSLSDQCQFFQWDLNKFPFPFPDSSFDAVYGIHVFSLSRNLSHLFHEFYRLLKPKGKFAFLDSILLEAYNPENAYHAYLLKELRPLIGVIGRPTLQQYLDALQKGGFTIQANENLSLDGRQAPLVRSANRFYRYLNFILNKLARWKLIPPHLSLLFERLMQGSQALLEADQLRLITSSHYLLAQKP